MSKNQSSSKYLVGNHPPILHIVAILKYFKSNSCLYTAYRADCTVFRTRILVISTG